MSSPPSLLDLLSNTLIFNLIIPHLPIASRLALSSTSRACHDILKTSPDTFRRLDLSGVLSPFIDRTPLDSGGISWRAQRMDEALMEEEFYSGPIRGLFYSLHKQNILKNVSTLILDHMYITTDVMSEIILDTQGKFNVKILSVLGTQQFLSSVSDIIKQALRPGRPEGYPQLQALYIFGLERTWPVDRKKERRVARRRQLPNDLHQPVPDAPLEEWYLPASVPFVTQSWKQEAIQIIEAAEGMIQFDGILCRGPKHSTILNAKMVFPYPAEPAEIALGAGCMECGTSPEGPAVYGESPPHWLPLLAPPPFTGSAKEASRPTRLQDGSFPPLYARCTLCVRHRQCCKCQRWICENCATDDDVKLWITTFAVIWAGNVPKTALRGYVYGDDTDDFRRSEDSFNSLRSPDYLCLERCMPEEYYGSREKV
ncbi:hypothetical protein TWF694_009418 [Orbilia ellipsospora]|uniref:F-box domain-containing protein n=1 Tax=Orbilia ellipsospora TaxID=2528407 RepID=A0AAV9XDF4_9PEZI